MKPSFKLVAHNGRRVKYHARQRPFYAYYFTENKKLGYDKIGRACEQDRAVASAVKQVLAKNANLVEIWEHNEWLVARITRRGRQIHIELKG